MSMNDLIPDSCDDIHILTDLSKHYESDTTLREDILSNPLLDSGFPSLIPHSFNLHALYSTLAKSSHTLYSKDLTFLDSSKPNHHLPLSTLCYRSVVSNIVIPSSSSANTLAHDILSTAPHFPPASTIQGVRTLQIGNYDVDSHSNQLNKKMINISHNFGLHTDSNDVKIDNNIEQNIAHYWSDLESRWQILAKNDIESHPWLVHQSETVLEKAYQFSLTARNSDCELMEKGISLLSQGKLSSAICHFESELQFRPENSQAWLYLGSSHAENEQDELSICALKKCISLDPTNLDARLLLAVGYTNESKNMLACRTLRQWLLSHPTFSSLFLSDNIEIHDPPFMPSFLDPIFHQEVLSQFDTAVSSSIGNPHEKGDLHVANGILYHLAEQYSVSVGHFKHALVLQPDNPMLWNKLGATLANGDRSEDAIQAYKEALRLYPNYVRCRYNLGIACMNMKSFPEACGHFLSALKLQNSGKGPSSTAWNLWSTLRLAVMLGDMPKLFSMVDNRDLDTLLVEFNLHL